MKCKTTLGLLCFLMLSFSIGLLDGDAEACDLFKRRMMMRKPNG